MSRIVLAAAGAKAALLAGKRQRPFRMALLAHHAQEALIEYAAAQERLELLAHVLDTVAGMNAWFEAILAEPVTLTDRNDKR